jgi:hypothetical protein
VFVSMTFVFFDLIKKYQPVPSTEQCSNAPTKILGPLLTNLAFKEQMYAFEKVLRHDTD